MCGRSVVCTERTIRRGSGEKTLLRTYRFLCVFNRNCGPPLWLLIDCFKALSKSASILGDKCPNCPQTARSILMSHWACVWNLIWRPMSTGLIYAIRNAYDTWLIIFMTFCCRRNARPSAQRLWLGLNCGEVRRALTWTMMSKVRIAVQFGRGLRPLSSERLEVINIYLCVHQRWRNRLCPRRKPSNSCRPIAEVGKANNRRRAAFMERERRERKNRRQGRSGKVSFRTLLKSGSWKNNGSEQDWQSAFQFQGSRCPSCYIAAERGGECLFRRNYLQGTPKKGRSSRIVKGRHI